MKKLFIYISIISLFILPKFSYAHFLWLNVDDYTPSPGQKITVSLGWGHEFPSSLCPRKDMKKYIKLFLIDPNGKKINLSFSINLSFHFLFHFCSCQSHCYL